MIPQSASLIQDDCLEKALPAPNASIPRPAILMCPPDYFEVAYAINPWMNTHSPAGRCDINKAKLQWQALRRSIEATGTTVLTMPAVEGLPDLVFTANAAFVYGNKALIASYKHPERQPEEEHDARWFESHQFEVHRMEPGTFFEGAGDALIWQSTSGDQNAASALVLAGYRTRTDIAAHNRITQLTGLPVLSLELSNPSFYHIDVCLCPTETGHLIYWPGAFDDYGRSVIESHVPEDKRIIVEDDEAHRFACNAVSIGSTVIFNAGSPKLAAALESKGLAPVMVDLSEFLKAGGSSKCLTLRIG
ncbi:MAG: arginine deiminase-related protein [Vampirovibrionales bacterium]|nr:arginine deiminase-related protein [Vampirovibrionales bacterium]